MKHFNLTITHMQWSFPGQTTVWIWKLTAWIWRSHPTFYRLPLSPSRVDASSTLCSYSQHAPGDQDRVHTDGRTVIRVSQSDFISTLLNQRTVGQCLVAGKGERTPQYPFLSCIRAATSVHRFEQWIQWVDTGCYLAVTCSGHYNLARKRRLWDWTY
jgi:hypothetical protein